MRKLGLWAGLLAIAVPLLALPALAPAKHHQDGDSKARGAAARACKAERKDIGRDAFKAKYANDKGKHAFDRCVRQHLDAARATCNGERDADMAAFKTTYADKKGKHAFRRCVRQHSSDPVS
ncbi:MAG: hypothetical protein QOG09_734 [Solirubrobacterales bacterium]|jgi:hypothetical protein|nr:hypothetical protein [Solirubrobacterales bacterium]MDX6662632.1 hypothetical protein [Solirubrobacterales bacterium]